MTDGTIRRPRTGVARGLAAATKELAKRTTKTQHRPPDQKDYGPEESIEEFLTDREFGPEQPAAYVRMGAGGTYSLGKFESLRLDVSVTLPCLPSEVNDALDTCAELVATRLSEEERTWGIGNRKGN